MFELISFAGPTTFYVVETFPTLEEAISAASALAVGDGLQIESDGEVLWSRPGPTN